METIGRITAIFRYPVKSMAGETLQTAEVGWHGVDGDRRMAFARRGIRGGFPWLTASKMPSLVTHVPFRSDEGMALPDRVRTPDGRELELGGQLFREELSTVHGTPVELLEVGNGIFDDACVSLISAATVAAVTSAAGVAPDSARFRPNLLIDADADAFGEDAWVGSTLGIGDPASGPLLSICMRDLRRVMINLDPASSASDPRVLKSAGTLNQACAGVYATVTRTGSVRVGDPLYRL